MEQKVACGCAAGVAGNAFDLCSTYRVTAMRLASDLHYVAVRLGFEVPRRGEHQVATGDVEQGRIRPARDRKRRRVGSNRVGIHRGERGNEPLSLDVGRDHGGRVQLAREPKPQRASSKPVIAEPVKARVTGQATRAAEVRHG